MITNGESASGTWPCTRITIDAPMKHPKRTAIPTTAFAIDFPNKTDDVRTAVASEIAASPVCFSRWCDSTV